ncbi:MAG TPA: hypothetical protein VKD72_28580 [Gemmataceae bacterium]|nr:hypothetical protein [Gemmataceae bacterium]
MASSNKAFCPVHFAEVGPAQVGAREVGPLQVGPAQVSAAQHGPAQVGPAQVGVLKVCKAEVSSPEVGACQVDALGVGTPPWRRLLVRCKTFFEARPAQTDFHENRLLPVAGRQFQEPLRMSLDELQDQLRPFHGARCGEPPVCQQGKERRSLVGHGWRLRSQGSGVIVCPNS